MEWLYIFYIFEQVVISNSYLFLHHSWTKDILHLALPVHSCPPSPQIPHPQAFSNLQSPSASTKCPDEGLPSFCSGLVVVPTSGIEEGDRGFDIQPQVAQDTTKKATKKTKD